MNDQYIIGVDYGTGSVRSVTINAANGNEIPASVFYYPRGEKDCIVTLQQIYSGQ